MLSVFQIFKMLIGIIVFIFVLTFFLRISDMYTGLQETGRYYDAINVFDETLMNTYTSGNPGEFSTFEGFEYLIFGPPEPGKMADHPRLWFPAGQKTLSVPAFVLTYPGVMEMERRCDDFEWSTFCYVISYPDASAVLFTPIENTPASREIMKEIVEKLPDGMGYGYCNGDSPQIVDSDNPKSDFLAFIDNQMDAMGNFQPCTVDLPDYYWFITVGNDAAGKNEAVVRTIGQGKWSLTDAAGAIRPMLDAGDVGIFLTNGSAALDNKRALLEEELSTSVRIMKARSELVKEKMLEENREPCQNCPTEYPRECGYMDYHGSSSGGEVYDDFIEALGDLEQALDSGLPHDTVLARLADTETAYETLIDRGCE